MHLVGARRDETIEHRGVDEREAVRRERAEDRSVERREDVEDGRPFQRLAATQRDGAAPASRAALGSAPSSEVSNTPTFPSASTANHVVSMLCAAGKSALCSSTSPIVAAEEASARDDDVESAPQAYGAARGPTARSTLYRGSRQLLSGASAPRSRQRVVTAEGSGRSTVTSPRRARLTRRRRRRLRSRAATPRTGARGLPSRPAGGPSRAAPSSARPSA